MILIRFVAFMRDDNFDDQLLRKYEETMQQRTINKSFVSIRYIYTMTV